MMKGTKCYEKTMKKRSFTCKIVKTRFRNGTNVERGGILCQRRWISQTWDSRIALTQTTKLRKRCELLMHDTDRSPHPASSTDSCKFVCLPSFLGLSTRTVFERCPSQACFDSTGYITLESFRIYFVVVVVLFFIFAYY